MMLAKIHSLQAEWEAPLLTGAPASVQPQGQLSLPFFWPLNTQRKYVKVQSVYAASELSAAAVPGKAGMKSNYASAALPAKGKEPKVPAPVTPSLLSNKVKTKDLYRSQVFSAKSQKQQQQQPPSTLYVNKNVDPGEAAAAIALLNKHEKAMKRYEAAAAQQQS